MPEPRIRLCRLSSKLAAELEDALFELEKLPAISQSSVFFAAHTLNNFLTVTGGNVELLLSSLANYPDPQVHIGLKGCSRQPTDDPYRQPIDECLDRSGREAAV